MKNKNDTDNFIEQLYTAYSNGIYRYLLGQNHPPDVAWDIMHDVFWIAMIKKDKLQESPNKIGWLYQTAKYCSKKEFDKMMKQSKLAEKLIVEYETPPPIEQEPTSLVMIDAQNILNENEFEYIHEHFQMGKSNQEIAEEKGKSLSAITSFANRIYTKLRRNNFTKQ